MSAQCILVVEDHRSLLRGLRSVLETEGYRVLSAADGAEALQIMEERCPDLIVADILMPRMDGYAFHRAVHARPDWAAIPFVFLTAKAQEEDRLRGQELGVDSYITKPFDPEELLKTVRSLLG